MIVCQEIYRSRQYIDSAHILLSSSQELHKLFNMLNANGTGVTLHAIQTLFRSLKAGSQSPSLVQHVGGAGEAESVRDGEDGGEIARSAEARELTRQEFLSLMRFI